MNSANERGETKNKNNPVRKIQLTDITVQNRVAFSIHQSKPIRKAIDEGKKIDGWNILCCYNDIW